MESALSPNTAAFLDYLSAQIGSDDSKAENGEADPAQQPPASLGQVATSLPPSAFFQIPPTSSSGNSLPTPISNKSTSASPSDVKPQTHGDRSLSLSESDEGNLSGMIGSGAAGGSAFDAADAAHHKRKAGGHHLAEDDEGEEEETDSDAVTGHEDKRHHQSAKPTRKGGRKSGAGEDGNPGKEMSKAARRKEQNRAAQKAFRERREARVNDLEAKVAELEAKSFSSNVENENLRSILKRLQEENVSLKQSAFTFAMPRSGTSNQNSPSSLANKDSPLHRVNSKPPTPPYSQADEPLKSINDPSPINTNTGSRPHRQSSSGMSGMAASPDSLNSAMSSGSSRGLLNGNSPMRFDSFSSFSNDTGITPPSVASDNKSDLEALWASFYPQNNASGPAQPQQQKQQPPVGQPPANPQTMPALASINPLTQFLAAQIAQGKLPADFQAPNTQNQSYNSSAPNMAYRDPSAAAPAPNTNANWGNMNNTSIDDFLASLTGSNNGSMDDNPVSAVDDDAFNQQLQAILAGGGFEANGSNGSTGVGLNGQVGANNAFSPTNYLNMSPSPLNTLSNSASPQSALVSGTSNSASPESSNASSAPPKELSPEAGKPPGPAWMCGEVVNVVDEKGNVIKPSDLWVKMGMQQQDNVDNLLIDDLCDQMRAKAKCTDNGAQLKESDLHHMMGYDEQSKQKRQDDLKQKYGWGQIFGTK